ncbi:glycosyl hydrolase family 61-domain-containing protein [Mycena leptocephala]|nr:glycosyl hydrolase family 61-domain-containing protein [Mycena leptocephala]
MKSTTAILFFASILISAAGHGWVTTVTIADKTYTGNPPMETQPKGKPSVIRQIQDNMPVTNLTLNELICGRGAKPAALVATVASGDAISLTWRGYPDDREGAWIHDVGPILTYLAACGTSCTTFSPTQETQWFKVSEQGTQSNGNWIQEQLYSGFPVNVTIPQSLKAGNYLLRHEVIALHMAQLLGGAELFPSCVQLAVTGDGTRELTGNEHANFPGAYMPTDPGLFVDVYTNFQGDKYQFPGPPVATFSSISEYRGEIFELSDSESGDGDDSDDLPAAIATSNIAGSRPAGGARAKSSRLVPIMLKKLFGGEIASPVSLVRRREAFTEESLYMELLAAEHSDEEPDVGALEGSGDDYDG